MGRLSNGSVLALYIVNFIVLVYMMQIFLSKKNLSMKEIAYMYKKLKSIVVIMLSILIFVFTASTCYGNSAEPPSILIIVPNPPSDLEISIDTGNTYVEANKVDKVVVEKVIERYYIFYSSKLGNTRDYVFKITTGDDSYEIAIEKPLKSYNNIYTLNLKNRTLTPGKLLSRSILLVLIRVILTLVIEGIIFWLFGFRNKDYWIAFFIINIITQGALNIWINGFTPIESYLILNLVAAEILVFIAEIKAFLTVIKSCRWHTVLYVLTANLVSFIAGSYIITFLPI